MISFAALIGFIFVPAFIILGGFAASDEGDQRADGDASEGFDRARVEGWVEERAPGREAAFKFNRTTTRVIDDNYNRAVEASEVVNFGSDEWLFFAGATAQPCFSPEVEAQWQADIAEVELMLTAAGKEMILAIAPDRAIVVPELLGDIDNECEVANTAVVERLAQSPAVLNLSGVVSGSDHSLQLDTHWSPAGAMAGAEAIVEAIEPGTWVDHPLSSEIVDRPGDLDRMVGYDNTETVNLLTIEHPMPTSIERLETSVPGYPLVRATTPGAADRNVLVIHDSYGGYNAPDDVTKYQSGAAAQYLRPWFSHVNHVRETGNVISEPPVTAALAEADIVVFLFVQRELPVRLVPGLWPGSVRTALGQGG